MFIRIFRPREDRELLVNVNHISKIELEYDLPGGDGEYWRTSLHQAFTNPDAVRFYRFHVAGEELVLRTNPGSNVMTVFDEIYKNAIKD